MQANEILKEGMTLEEKLKAIDEATRKAVEKLPEKMKYSDIPVDPASLLVCESCE